MASMKEHRSFGCRLRRMSKCMALSRCAQAQRDSRWLSRPFLSMVITSSRQGLWSTTSFSFSSTSMAMYESGAAFRRARRKGVVRVRSPRCIKKVTRIRFRFNSMVPPPFPPRRSVFVGLIDLFRRQGRHAGPVPAMFFRHPAQGTGATRMVALLLP